MVARVSVVPLEFRGNTAGTATAPSVLLAGLYFSLGGVADVAISDSAGEADLRSEPAAPPTGRSRRYLAIITGMVVLFYAAVALTNVRLDPLAYDEDYVREMAKSLNEGQNFALYDPNINWRSLRRQQIALLTETPDVVVFGGSRWQEASADLLPTQKLFNAHVHSDYVEDFLALAQLLEEHDRLPDTLILSLRYITFEPIDVRVPTDWREWTPEYRQMADRLGIESHDVLDTLPVDKWTAPLSVRVLVDRVKLKAAQTETVGPTTDTEKATLDVIGSDGSLQWSQRNTRRFTPEFAVEDARKKAKANKEVRPAIDPAAVTALEKLLAHLQSKEVRVVFAQTPFHPAFYDAMRGRPFGEALGQVEQLAERWESTYGTTTVGSFDPGRVGCDAGEFIDWHHAKPACLGRILTSVPWPAEQ